VVRSGQGVAVGVQGLPAFFEEENEVLGFVAVFGVFPLDDITS
jgi:hypothetical protein